MREPTFPAAVCKCSDRRWNGYGTCLTCGGAYEPSGNLAPIAIPPTVIEIPREDEL